MNILTLKKTISTAVLVAYSAVAVLLPMASAQAAVVCDASNPTTASGGSPGCAVKRFPTGPYAYPKIDWHVEGSIVVPAASNSNLAYASGNKGIVENNRSALALGLQGNHYANIMALLPTNVPFVFARYNPMSLDLEVDVFKIESSGNRRQMMRAAYTPENGKAYAAAMTYATSSAQQMALGPGANPFERFGTPGDAAFHHIKDQNIAQVVVGHAMRATGAAIGLVAVAHIDPELWTTKSGGFFIQTVTQHARGWGSPKWFVATPKQFLPDGEVAQAVCQISVTAAPLCPPELAMPSGVAWREWTGGSLPSYKDVISNYEESKSGLTMIGAVVGVFLAALILGPAAAQMFGAVGGAAGPMTAIMTAIGPAGASATAAGFGVVEAAAYEALAAAATSIASGANPISIVNGPYHGAADGYGNAKVPSDAASKSMYDGMIAGFDAPSIEGSKVTAINDAAFGKTCAPGATIASCGGGSGVVPRSDSAVSESTGKLWMDNGSPMPLFNPFKLH